ncbi:MAG: hypothetical protein ACTSVZ_04995 [Promethearchaeota archaeon]
MAEDDLEVLAFYEDDIHEKRQLPYTLTVEKVEGDLIYTHNQWGNNSLYKRLEDGTYLLLDDES